MLKLVETFRVEVEFQCEDCGWVINLPTDYADDIGEPEYVQCSRCWVAEAAEHRRKRDREKHTPRRFDLNGKPIRIPPMIDIDTRDLPGFIHDKAATQIAKQRSLFWDRDD